MRMLTLVAIVCIAASACSKESGESLPRLAAAKSITVSGLSAGAYMAGQYHVAYSDTVSGAALVAGGPWACAQGDISRALSVCMTGQGLELSQLVTLAQQSAAANDIAPLAGLNDDSVFVFHGAQDEVVTEAVSDAAANWYRAVSPDISLAIENTQQVVHGWPTENTGTSCDQFAAPFVYACDYDLAGELLEFLLGDLAPAATRVADLHSFSQLEFNGEGLADNGLVYVPKRCEEKTGCRIHVFFHGCGQSVEQVGQQPAASLGLLRWAESNDLIVLFPQVAVSRIAPLNPLACWDWWGYSGQDYLTTSANQLGAARKMVERLQESR